MFEASSKEGKGQRRRSCVFYVYTPVKTERGGTKGTSGCGAKARLEWEGTDMGRRPGERSDRARTPMRHTSFSATIPPLTVYGRFLDFFCSWSVFKKLSIVGAVPRPPWPPVSHPRALAKAFIYNINRVDAIHGALKSMVPISLIPLSGNLLSGERRAHRAHRLAARPA